MDRKETKEKTEPTLAPGSKNLDKQATAWDIAEHNTTQVFRFDNETPQPEEQP